MSVQAHNSFFKLSFSRVKLIFGVFSAILRIKTSKNFCKKHTKNFKIVLTFFFVSLAIFLQKVFPIGLFDYDCRICFISIFHSGFFLSHHTEKKRHYLKKNFLFLRPWSEHSVQLAQ